MSWASCSPISARSGFAGSEAFQEKYGYPAMTDEIRRKIFGLNAASVYGLDVEEIRKTETRDELNGVKKAYLEAPNPSYQTFGPKTRREFLHFRRDILKHPG